jgi:hypothetical protein
MHTSDHGPLHHFEGLGGVANGVTGIKLNVSEVFLDLQLEMNSLRFLNIRRGKNLNVFIVECNLPIKLKSHSFPNTHTHIHF